jgi:hypothetical protein
MKTCFFVVMKKRKNWQTSSRFANSSFIFVQQAAARLFRAFKGSLNAY